MLNLDPAKLLIIAVVAIILLGPDKLPQVARQVGGAWRSFNEFRHRMESEVRNSIPDLPPSHEIARLARSPSALLNHLSNMGTDGTANGNGNGTGTATDGAADNAAGAPPAPAPVAPLPSTTTTAGSPARPAPQPGPSPEFIVPGDPTLN
jgi:sec-independent protein translocase protein TatB